MTEGARAAGESGTGLHPELPPAAARDVRDRYSRQVRTAQIGAAGQQRLGSAHALVVGCGALGTHSAEALVRAGVGRLTLVDRDIVEWSNLQRQVLFTERDAEEAMPKAVAAAAHLAAINREVPVTAHVAECDRALLDTLPLRPDVVLDGTDNFAVRYLLNDWCKRAGVPWIYAGAVGTEAAAMVIRPDGPCLRCLWPEPPAQSDVGSCETAGILAPAIAAVAAFQVAEALKLLVGVEPTRGVFTCDVWRGHYQVLSVAMESATDCVVCAGRDHPALRAAPTETATLCGRDAVQILPRRSPGIALSNLADRLRPVVGDLRLSPHLLRFTADGVRFSVFPDGRALLFGVQDPLRAKALFDRWLGFA